MPIIRLPKKKARPNGNAMSRGLINGYSPRLHDGSRKSRSDTDISLKKSAPTMKRICPKIKLTDRDCGQDGSQCAVPMPPGRNQGKTARQSKKPKIQWRQGTWQPPGKRYGSLWRKASRQEGKNRRKSVETRKIRMDKRIKMVILQTEW